MYAVFYKRKRNFWKNIDFGSVALTFHYGGCFNASLSRYTFKFILHLKVDSEKITGPNQC